METLTINNTQTVQALKELGANIISRESNHQVTFSMNGKLYEIAAKNNREYRLNRLNDFKHDFQKELAADVNPLNLINRDWKA